MATIARAKLFGKLNRFTYNTLEGAMGFCALRNNSVVEVEHWLHQIASATDSDYLRIIRFFGLDEAKLTQDSVAALGRLPRGATSRVDFSEHIVETIQQAWLYSTFNYNSTSLRSGHLLLTLARTPKLTFVLREISPEFEKIKPDVLAEDFLKIVAGSPEEGQAPVDGSTFAPARAGAAGADAPEGQGGTALSQFSVDLTEKARKKEMDPIVGRDDEIRQMIDILMRRRQNNPILTGEPGVGKTALVEGFAQRVAAGDVPPMLKDVAVRTLDMGLLQAGAGAKGEFENRLRAVIEEVQSSPKPIILFIDEAHTLIGAGGTAGQNDAANLLKPALARGTLRTIAATTWAEYKQYFEKDPALTRRFQVVKVGEPDEVRCLRMLRGMVSALEKHHKTQVLDEALEAAVRLSHRYIPSRQLPDKAVSLLDTACARVALSQHAKPAALETAEKTLDALRIELTIIDREAASGVDHQERRTKIISEVARLEEEVGRLQKIWEAEVAQVQHILELRRQVENAGNLPAAELERLKSELQRANAELQAAQGESPLVFPLVGASAVAETVADWTGIPVGKMVKDEITSLLHIADSIEKRVIGQRHALDLIGNRLRVSKASLENPTRPIGVFMLAGPSGVGKTETALAIADAMYGGSDALITINMSEFKESHKVATLMGSPPGYVGYGKGGILTEAVRRRPYSVVLLDEVEKAHPDIHEVFFQVFDKGIMQDSEGLEVDFKNTLILLTSNVGSDLIMKMCKDPSLMPTMEGLNEALREPLLKKFPAALLGRIQVIPYFPISDSMLRHIIRLQLDRVGKRVTGAHAVNFSYSDDVVELIAARCTETESGARAVDAIISRTILPELSTRILNQLASGEKLSGTSLSVVNGEFAYTM